MGTIFEAAAFCAVDFKQFNSKSLMGPQEMHVKGPQSLPIVNNRVFLVLRRCCSPCCCCIRRSDSRGSSSCCSSSRISNADGLCFPHIELAVTFCAQFPYKTNQEAPKLNVVGGDLQMLLRSWQSHSSVVPLLLLMLV